MNAFNNEVLVALGEPMAGLSKVREPNDAAKGYNVAIIKNTMCNRFFSCELTSARYILFGLRMQSQN